MEDCAVIELARRLFMGEGMGPLALSLSELDEVLYGDGRVGLKQLDGDFALGGAENCVSAWKKCHGILDSKSENCGVSEVRRRVAYGCD
jgi:hypothetical protein